ncbi:tyrosine-type recombinase/integrase [Desulfovibrio falkowii]|uniref:Integrase n=1 Tax=Desulfovibrio falkowii TaxID=3136602 RepID=A0ABQ0EAW7_9BACT
MAKGKEHTPWVTVERGIRKYEHLTRKHGLKPDVYYALRYRVEGKRYEEGLGWASQGWTLERARLTLAELMVAKKTGSGEVTLRERRVKAQEERAEAKRQQEARRRLAVTLSEYWHNNYFPNCRQSKAPETWRKEESNFRTWLAPALGDVPLREISKADLDAIKSKMASAGLAKRTTQLVFATMRAVWNHARGNKLVEGTCPTQEIKLGKISNARNRALSSNEAQELLEEIQRLDEKAWAFTLACLHTGGRLSEVARLTWGQVNLRERHLTLVHTKTGKPRAVPMTETLVSVLRSMPHGQAQDIVFTNAQGKQWTSMPANFRKAVANLKLNEGRTDRRELLVFHSLRHSAASMLLDAGENVRTIQELFGWSTLAMLQRYTHPTDEKKQRAMGRLDSKLKQQPANVHDFSEAQQKGSA